MRALAAALALLAACSPPEGRQAATSSLPPGAAPPNAAPPNIVVVLVDTLRADHTSLLGYERDTTPHLRRIGADGLVLRRHLANAPWTKPSVASILTGLHPTAHGARYGHHRHSANRQVDVLSDSLRTLPEALRERGYATAAWMTNAHLRSEWGFDQGYDEYRFRDEPVRRGEMPAVDRQGIDFTIALLRRTLGDAAAPATGPLFVWTHLMAVHQYESDPEQRLLGDDPALEGPVPIDRQGRHAWRVLRYPDLGAVVADYDDAVHSTDAEIGRLYDVIRREVPNTVLVVTSDHGEELYDHGGFEHGATLYNELLWVPAVLSGPGVPPGTSVGGLTDSIDLFPTLIELAGGEATPTASHGRTLIRQSRSPPRQRRPAEGKRESFAERHALGPTLGFSLLSSDGFKLIVAEHRRTGRTVSREVFADGQRIETEPLPTEEAREVAVPLTRRIGELRARAAEIHAATVGETPTREADAEDLERLRSLGYVQ